MARLADVMGTAQRPDGPTPADGDRDGENDTGADTAGPEGLRLSTRQALQVGVATSLAIIVGELVSPSRWYWAVSTAFVVFVGTSSRGDVLSRGSQRVVGTIGGVIAGMGLAVLVGGHPLPALLLLFGCGFLALYLVRSQALMAFWITAVLALRYGLIGQFSVETLVVRIEETAIGAAMGMLAGYLVLPKRTREALDEMVDAARTPDPHRRADLLGAARLLRRIDQAVVGFATDIGRRDETAEPRPPAQPLNDQSDPTSGAKCRAGTGTFTAQQTGCVDGQHRTAHHAGPVQAALSRRSRLGHDHPSGRRRARRRVGDLLGEHRACLGRSRPAPGHRR